MGYSGLVSSEFSSGNRIQRGHITKTGNAQLRRVIKDLAWKAQWRLHHRYNKLAARGKNKNQIVTAVGRELLGFIWAIAVRKEKA